MILTRLSCTLVRLLHCANKPLLNCCHLSTDRPETISAALKRFYLKVHPDLFTQYPKEKVLPSRIECWMKPFTVAFFKEINEKSLQMVSAYLSALQRKEHMAAITVSFFTKLPATLPPRRLAGQRNTFFRIHLSPLQLLLFFSRRIGSL